MIADLKTDSARWEADKQRRDLRPGTYQNDTNAPPAPNRVPENYPSSAARHEPREPSYPAGAPYSDPAYGRPPTTFSSAPNQPAYGGGYSQPSNYPPAPAYSAAPAGYVPAPAAPPVTTPEMASSYTYSGNGYSYPDRSGAAPRYPAYEQEPDYPPSVSSGMPYPPTTAPDHRLSPMDYGQGRAPPRDHRHQR